MTDLNLTPGLSYRDYVQDAVLDDGSPAPESVFITTTAGGIAPETYIWLKNATNNIPREKSKIDPILINLTSTLIEYRASITLTSTLSSFESVTHAGYLTMDIGSLGLFNVASNIYDYETSTISVATTLTIGVVELGGGSHVYDYDISEVLRKKNQNIRYSLNNIFIPLLDSNNEQRTNIDKVVVQIDFAITKDIADSLPPDPYLTLGRLWIGNYMPVSFDAPWGIAVDNPAKINESAGLDAHPIQQRRRRRVTYPISSIEKDDAFTTIEDLISDEPFASFSDMQLQCGKDYPIVMSHQRLRNESSPELIYPDPYVIYGLVSKDITMTHVSGPLHQTEIQVKELI